MKPEHWTPTSKNSRILQLVLEVQFVLVVHLNHVPPKNNKEKRNEMLSYDSSGLSAGKDFLSLLTPGPGMPLNPSGPGLPGCPCGPTGPTLPGRPWPPIVPYKKKKERTHVGKYWSTKYWTKLLVPGPCPCLGSLVALLSFISRGTNMTLTLKRDYVISQTTRTTNYTGTHVNQFYPSSRGSWRTWFSRGSWGSLKKVSITTFSSNNYIF